MEVSVTRAEIRNIIQEGWEERREKIENQRKRGNETTKRWQTREKLILENKIKTSDVRRWRQYRPPSSN